MAVRRFSESDSNVGPEDIQLYGHLIAFGKKGCLRGEICCPHGVAIHSVTNHIYVAGGSSGISADNFAGVSIFSETGTYLTRYSDKRIGSLWGIAIHGSDVYVTDPTAHAVFHLKINEVGLKLVDRKSHTGYSITQFKMPYQLTVSSTGEVYVADSGNDKIQILDSSLHPIREVTHPDMHCPYDVKVTTEEMYVLNSVQSFCVQVYSHDGCKLRSLITRGNGMQVSLPFFFCLDNEKRLFVSDCDSHRIKVFSNEGDLLHTLGEHGHQRAMFNFPFGLALTNNRLVIVSVNSNYCIQIFYE